jgi:hypothetical protein
MVEIVKLNVEENPFEFYQPVKPVPCVLCNFNDATKGLVLSVAGVRRKLVVLAVCEKCAAIDGEKVGAILRAKRAWSSWLETVLR